MLRCSLPLSVFCALFLFAAEAQAQVTRQVAQSRLNLALTLQAAVDTGGGTTRLVRGRLNSRDLVARLQFVGGLDFAPASVILERVIEFDPSDPGSLREVEGSRRTLLVENRGVTYDVTTVFDGWDFVAISNPIAQEVKPQRLARGGTANVATRTLDVALLNQGPQTPPNDFFVLQVAVAQDISAGIARSAGRDAGVRLTRSNSQVLGAFIADLDLFSPSVLPGASLATGKVSTTGERLLGPPVAP